MLQDVGMLVQCLHAKLWKLWLHQRQLIYIPKTWTFHAPVYVEFFKKYLGIIPYRVQTVQKSKQHAKLCKLWLRVCVRKIHQRQLVTILKNGTFYIFSFGRGKSMWSTSPVYIVLAKSSHTTINMRTGAISWCKIYDWFFHDSVHFCRIALHNWRITSRRYSL